jgi:hypothetical protein
MNSWVSELWRRLRFFVNRQQFERDLDEEMRLHKELRQQEYRRQGNDPESARYQAQRQFGNDTLLKEVSREMRGWHSLEILLHDVRYGLRMLAKNPGFTAVAVSTLALGIGANTAIFQLLDAVRLRSLPVPNPQQLSRIQIRNGNGGFGITPDACNLTYPVAGASPQSGSVLGRFRLEP